MKQAVKLLCLTFAASSIVGCGSIAAPGSRTRATTAGSMRTQHLDARRNTAPQHVLTWASIRQVDHISPTQAAPYLDWAAVNVADANPFSAAGIKTLLYTDPNRVSPDERMYTNDETTFAHDCKGNRITIYGRPGPKYQMDPSSSKLVRLWRAWVKAALRGGHYDAIFDDSADSVHNTSALPCGFDQIKWTEASNLMNANLGQPIFYNGLGTLVPPYNQPPVAIGLNPTTLGGELEGCYESTTTQIPIRTVWNNYETTEMTMATAHKQFVCRGITTLPPKVSLRMYMYASFLLTYDPASSIISEKFSTPGNLGVFPEDTFVALNPLIPSPPSVASLQTSQWTFGRQYGACYLWGQAVGSCAVVVNADGPKQAHPFPWPGVYNHTLTIAGAGVLDGGIASATGPPPPSQIPGTRGLIAIQ